MPLLQNQGPERSGSSVSGRITSDFCFNRPEVRCQGVGVEPLRVLVIVDRADRCRGQFWESALQEISDHYKLKTERCFWPLTDKLLEPLTPEEPVLFEKIEASDVLILNWDVINGDPDFGADLAQKWFERRWPSIRRWLASADSKKGRVLIVEGQAVLGIPDRDAYSAVLGPGEVAVSGPENPWRPDAPSLKRMVGECRMTRAALRAPGFDITEPLKANRELDFDTLFPGTAGRLLPSEFQKIRYPMMLYRGWFQHRLRQRTLRWVVYARRTRRWPLNYATLLGAKVGNNGVVFATTMLLSATRQMLLIAAMLEASGRIAELPDPGRARQWLGKYLPRTVAGFLTAAIALWVESVWIRPDPWMRLAVSSAVGLVTFVFFDSLQWLLRQAYLAARKIRGL